MILKQTLTAAGLMLGLSLLNAATYRETYQDGIARIRKGDRAGALARFQEAQKLAVTQSEKVNVVLQITWAMPDNQKAEALKMLQQFRKDNPKLSPQNEAFVLLREGTLQVQLKQYAEGAKNLEYVLSGKYLSERDRMLGCDMLSNALIHQGKYDKCLQTLDSWEALDSLTPNDFCRMQTRRVGVLGALKRFDEAYKAGEDAAALDGVSPLNRALAYQMLAFVAFRNEKNPQKAKGYSEKSRSVSRGKNGFNAQLHAQILKACESGK